MEADLNDPQHPGSTDVDLTTSHFFLCRATSPQPGSAGRHPSGLRGGLHSVCVVTMSIVNPSTTMWLTLVLIVVCGGGSEGAHVTLRSNDGAEHVVDVWRVKVHSYVYAGLSPELEHQIDLPNTADSELRLIVEFINTTEPHETGRASRWAHDILRMRGIDVYNLLLLGADSLQLHVLQTAIQSVNMYNRAAFFMHPVVAPQFSVEMDSIVWAEQHRRQVVGATELGDVHFQQRRRRGRPGGNVPTVTLRSSDHVAVNVTLRNVCEHSIVLRHLIEDVDYKPDLIQLHHIAGNEVKLIAAFIGRIKRNEVGGAFGWASEAIRTLGLDAQCRLVEAVDYLNVDLLMKAIGSNKRSWNAIVEMKTGLKADALETLVNGVPGIARLLEISRSEIALPDREQQVTNFVKVLREHLISGCSSAASISRALDIPLVFYLHWFSKTGESLIVELLVSIPGININSRVNTRNWTPLHWASYQGYVEVVHALLETPRIRVNARDVGRWTPLHLAASHGHVHIVEMLTKQPRVDVNARDAAGWTPLHWAALKGHGLVTVWLLESPQVNANVEGCDGRVPSDVAIDHGHYDIAALLLNAQLKPTYELGSPRW